MRNERESAYASVISLINTAVCLSWWFSGKPATKALRLKETQSYTLNDINLLKYNIPLFRFLSAKLELFIKRFNEFCINNP